MKTIRVVKSFVLTLRNEVKKFEAGVHEVEEKIANHWYVKAHSEPVAAPVVEAPAAASPASNEEAKPEATAPAAAEADAKKAPVKASK